MVHPVYLQAQAITVIRLAATKVAKPISQRGISLFSHWGQLQFMA
jgi:hypothetical protein